MSSCSTYTVPLIVIPLVIIVAFLRLGSKIEISVTINHHSSSSKLRGSEGNGTQHQQIHSPSSSSSALIHNIDEYYMIPECASDIFFTLHRELSGREDEYSCRGMLIRDDIIITSRECSTHNVTFNFHPSGIEEAYPHTDLNSRKEMAHSPLGFLEASPPYHYYYIDEPVRRARMFLSRQRTPIVNGTEREVIFTCQGNKPIGHNFPVVKSGEKKMKMVPLGPMNGILPSDILWDHTDITAPELGYAGYKWWTKPIKLEDSEKNIAKMLQEYTGPPGSISIPDAHSDYEKQVAAVFEAVDPRGHRKTCLKHYVPRWRNENPFSGQHFFDWLDFGNGMNILEVNEEKIKNHDPTAIKHMENDADCFKKYMDGDDAHYMNDSERAFHKVYITNSQDGTDLIWRYKHNDELIPESEKDDPHLYVWDLEKTFYIVDSRWNKRKFGEIKHTSILAGRPALAAGKAYFGKGGAIWGINFASGHYRPKIPAITMMYEWHKEHHFNLTAMNWVGRNGWSESVCAETDWASLRIQGFEASSLERSCHEVTTNPTWMIKDDV